MRVEPEHVDGVIVPDGHDENGVLESLSLLGETSLGASGVWVTEDSLLVGTELIGDGVTWNTSDLGLWSGPDLASLSPEALDLNKSSAVGTSVGQELGDDRNWLGGVNGEAGSWTVEVQVAHAVSVDITSISIALGGVSVTNTAGKTSTLINTHVVARMWGKSAGDGVGFPDIHLVTAGTTLTLSGVGRVGVSSPSLSVGL